MAASVGKTAADPFAALNPQQFAAAQHGRSPLLIIAGAGTGKTNTLVHRVAHLIAEGTDPGRILLLTFTRRAAAEMLRRVESLLRRESSHLKSSHLAPRDESVSRSETATFRSRASRGKDAAQRIWGGTFHAVATRLLRMYGKFVGLEPGFTIHDRGDSEDLIDVVRADLGLGKVQSARSPASPRSRASEGAAEGSKRFPKKHTCLAMYSHCVNAQAKIEKIVPEHYPWCQDYIPDLKRLFQGYIDRKEAGSVLDYDDLLLFWRELLAQPEGAERVRARFDCVLVDEYQDTNRLQADVLKLLCPDGEGLTVVGDDAQSIYSFRAATIRNILEFPERFPGATVLKLEQNYRSTQPILSATNRVIACSNERYVKELWSRRAGGEPPWLVTCDDENEQADFVVTKILEHREAGLDLRRQAVLFRASHHSTMLEAELTRRDIPFVKYGGLKFMEAAHVKDLLAFLRLAENPRDLVAGTRVLTLLPGVGPAKARQLMEMLPSSSFNRSPTASEIPASTRLPAAPTLAAGERLNEFAAWASARVPSAAREHWPRFVRLVERLAGQGEQPLPPQLHAALTFYEPLLKERYDNPDSRLRDLEQLELLAARFSDRRTMLAELTLDPPSSTQDFAADPTLDEDYLILSTVHSAKGLEWNAVYVIHASDGNMPADMATKKPEQIEEERRLFYVALTRAKDALYVCYPLRYYHAFQNWRNAHSGFAKLTRFIPADVQGHFQDHSGGSAADADAAEEAPATAAQRRANARQQSRALWG